MKRNLLYLISVVLILTLGTGCKEKDMGTPAASTVASFSYVVNNQGYAPCEVTFTNSSLNAAGYLWDFGNGLTSTEANPTTSYATPGLYSVKLTCTPVNSVYYNQAQKGTDKTINDAGINNNTLHAQFLTYGGNAFTARPSVLPFS